MPVHRGVRAERVLHFELEALALLEAQLGSWQRAVVGPYVSCRMLGTDEVLPRRRQAQLLRLREADARSERQRRTAEKKRAAVQSSSPQRMAGLSGNSFRSPGLGGKWRASTRETSSIPASTPCSNRPLRNSSSMRLQICSHSAAGTFALMPRSATISTS